jgi:hypothetical protein
MNEIERLNPDLVVRATSTPAPAVRRAVALTGRTRRIVLEDLRRRTAAGEIESAGQLQLITSGPMAGQYAIRVILLPIPRPRSSAPRWLIAGGVALMGLAAVVGAFAWLLTAMSAASVAGLCVVLLAVLGIVVAAGADRRKRSGNVTVVSNINVGR